MRVFLCAGEASGDAYGAALVNELREQASELEFEGIGGAKMRAAGVQLHQDSSTWGVISIFQVLLRLPELTLGYFQAKRALTASRSKHAGLPSLFIPIDFGYMNIRLARHAKRLGWKVMYFVPPGSWRRDRQGKDLPTVTDAVVTPFQWSAEILSKMGANAYWFGHPIKQLIRLPEDNRRHQDLIAVLPGSRHHEIEENLPLIAETFLKLQGTPKAEFALAPSVDASAFQEKWEHLSGRSGDSYASGKSAEVLSRAHAAIVCSGTATLEAALCRCPMVVVYRLSKGMEVEVKLLRIRRPKYVALPNILFDRTVVPELIQSEATPKNLRQELEDLMEDSTARAQQLAAFDELDELLGPPDAIFRTATLALEILRS